MFGLSRMSTKDDYASLQSDFIQKAAIFKDQQTHDDIEAKEKKARAMVESSEFSDEGVEGPDEEAIDHFGKVGKKSSSISKVVYKGESFSTAGPMIGA